MTAPRPDPTTQLIHHPYAPPAGFEAPQPGIFKASTVFFPNVAALRARDWRNKSGYTYGLHGTPTTFLLEERLCALEGGAQCLLAPSGLAAIATVSLGLLKTGDEVLIPDNAYGPNKTLAEGELAAWGISHRLYDPMNLQDLAEKIGESTRLVWLEAPGSVTMEFSDLIAQVQALQAQLEAAGLDPEDILERFALQFPDLSEEQFNEQLQTAYQQALADTAQSRSIQDAGGAVDREAGTPNPRGQDGAIQTGGDLLT